MPETDLILVPESADPDLAPWEVDLLAPDPWDGCAHLVTFPDRPPMIMVVARPGRALFLPL